MENNPIKITCIEMETCRLNGEQENNLENFTFVSYLFYFFILKLYFI